MSKVTKKISKNINKIKEQEKKEDKDRKNLLGIAKIIFGILACSLAICMISQIAEGNYIFVNKDTVISTDEIIAGQTFNRQSGTYYVAFYNFDSTDENLDSTISELDKNISVYKVNLGDKFNHDIVSATSNKEAQSADQLAISGVTVIKIVDGKNEEYTEGYDAVVSYLNAIE